MKKIICFLLFGLFFMNFNYASAGYVPVEGDLIKTANKPAIYYYGSDGKRHLFSNEAIFWTWNIGSWKDQVIKTISQSDFDSISAGANVTARPGEVFIKFDNGNNFYAVKPGGNLCLVNAEFAKNQTIKKIIVQSGFEADYTKNVGCSLAYNTAVENLPEGSIYRYENGNQVFYKLGDGMRQIVGADGWNNNKFNINSLLIVKAPAPSTVLPLKTPIIDKENVFGIDSEINLRGVSRQVMDQNYYIFAHDLWLIVEKYKQHLSDHNLEGINSVMYQKYSTCEVENCNEFFDYAFQFMTKYPESDFSSHSIDDKQAILSTQVERKDDLYGKVEILFIKVDNTYKLLLINPKVFDYSFGIEEINKALIDSDGDGLTDREDGCEGCTLPGQNATSPSNRDSDGDGIWDGIEFYKNFIEYYNNLFQ